MKLEQSFEVQAPIEVVWVALNDLERVAPCLPGAAITGHDEDGTYHGEFKVKLGPTTAAYRGTIRIQSADEASHSATLAAKGTDKRGQGGANATIVNSLVSVEGGTRVDSVTDFSITGRLARFGRGGMIEDISNRLLRDFATCLASRLGEQAPTAPTGAEVTAGEAPPEAVAAAAPAVAPPSAEDATAGATAAAPGATAAATGATAAPGGTPPAAPGGTPPAAPGGTPPVAPATASSAARAAGPPPATAAAGGPSRPIAPPPASEPLKAGSLFWSVLWERIKRLFRRRS
jgi:carbon monoxide dehydrogenase subunit G